MNLFRRPRRKSAPPSSHLARRLPQFRYAAAPTIDQVHFICGLHRSGTTLLERLLVSRFDVSCLRASVPESEGQHLQSVYMPASHYGGPGKFAFSKDARTEIDALTDYAAHRERLLGDWQRFTVGDSPILLEKSPPNLTKIGWLRKVFAGTRFVVMTRDPRAVSGATQKWSKTSLYELMLHWNAAYSQAMEAFSDEDCILLRYEDLVDDPTAEVARVAAFLGLSPRKDEVEIEGRYRELSNSNGKYLAAHRGNVYGQGIWSQLGYSF